MSAEYKLLFRDTNGTLLHQTNVWRTLQYTKRVNGIHDLALQLNVDHPIADMFTLDALIEVWRRDLNNGVDWYLDFEGMARTSAHQLFENGNETFTLYAFGYSEFLTRRIVMYTTGQVYTSKSGFAETVMKEFVDENIGPGAVSPPRIEDGVMTGLSLEADLARGGTWSGARAYQNLFNVLQDVSRDTETFFDVVGVGDALFAFLFYEGQRGEDRSTQGLVQATGLNAAGNKPVVFSADLGNLATIAKSINRSQELNVVIALGQGIEDDRSYMIAKNTDAIAESPWNRREDSYNASQEQTDAALTSAANARLLDNAKQTNINFQPLLGGATILGRDFDWGDIITARYRDEDFHLSITDKTSSVREDTEDVTLQMKSVV